MAGIINAYVSGDSLVLITRDAQGRRITRSAEPEYVAYFKSVDLDEQMRRDLRTSVYVRGVRQDGEWIRVAFVNSLARADFCTDRRSFVKHFGLVAYEADVHPVLRYVLDNGATIEKPRRVFLDLETDSRVPFSRKEQMRVLCWALVDEDERVQIGVLEENTDRAERNLLTKLWRALEAYDQVCAWNGDNFDFPVLWARSRDRGCEVDAGRWLWLDHKVLFERMNKNSAESGDEKQSMSFNWIANAILGEGKEETPPDVAARFGKKSLGALSWDLWAAGGEWRDVLVSYNLRDTDLLRRIEKETGYIALFDSLCEVCNIFGDSAALNPTHQMDGFMMKLGLGRGIHFLTREYRDMIEQYRGAYVMDPKSCDPEWRAARGMTNGILKDVHVADFKSLYPSIIVTWNMSPETIVPADTPGACRSPLTDVWFDTRTRGLLPEALLELLRMRAHWEAEKAKCVPNTPEFHHASRVSIAYKVAANSFYGVIGSPFSRFFNRIIAESVTQCGKWLILQTLEHGERSWGIVGVYGDTDSNVGAGCEREHFEEFVVWCNRDLYPRLLREVGCTENLISLAYEKEFERIIFVSAKRYIARLRHYKGKAATHKSKPEIKGLEYKRGDATMLARKLQAQVIDLLCGGLNLNPNVATPTEELEHFHVVLSEARQHVLDEDLPLDEVKLTKAVTKSLKEYAVRYKQDGTQAAQPPHVVIAKELLKRGEEVSEGTRVEYFVADGSVSPARVVPAADYKGDADRFYVWETLVYPPTQRLLEAAFPGHDWKGWLKVRPPKPRKRLNVSSKAALLEHEKAS